ncbi:dTDP-4-dehydrorhamnose reductase [Oecophyllibacter saccharovorans]|uniref:dTDP-4-dehydrorhamnose reductase n=1 Tax=Oecophyllibacter saccharovorans TaxID=2558360 RepID=UPI00114183EA|nr:dTDP-4-dehydrorhamnose reductase [Oecophyllibacter saccharovorans]QDH15149.1 dTDP-4-dehydrorhamnose reductase [Oecophyllibacter saccharovorans]
MTQHQSAQQDATGPILVIGRNGQLATSLQKLGGARVIRIGRPEFSLDAPEDIGPLLDRIRPSVVINAAAWTAVDLAESEEEAAGRTNRSGPEKLAAETARRHIPFLHVSTDYVFDGEKGAPYTEEDPVHPVTAYGRTKEAGERAVLAASPLSAVFRTAWVYAPHGKNFVRTMLNAGAKNPVLRIVGDQKGNPTNADDLAAVLLGVSEQMQTRPWQENWHGIFHAVGSGEGTWYELAREALEEADRLGQKMPELQAIQTADWPTPAKRPADSRLDTAKLARTFGLTLPDWRESTRRTVQSLMEENRNPASS